MSISSKRERAVVDNGNIAYVHIEEAARVLGCSRQYVRNECEKGLLRGRLIGGAWHVERDNLVPYRRTKRRGIERVRLAAAAENSEIKRATLEKMIHVKRIVGSEIRRRK